MQDEAPPALCREVIRGDTAAFAAAAPGHARRHDMGDPVLTGPEFQPLRDHLERFAFRRSLCLALRLADPAQMMVVILVRTDRARRTSDADLQRLAAAGPRVHAARGARRRRLAAAPACQQPGRSAERAPTRHRRPLGAR